MHKNIHRCNALNEHISLIVKQYRLTSPRMGFELTIVKIAR